MNSDADWAAMMEPVACDLRGEPNARLSNPRELRWGTKGSLTVALSGDKPGTWFDFEANRGGGVLAFVECELGVDKAGALRWLEDNGYLPASRPPHQRQVNPRPASARARPRGGSREDKPSADVPGNVAQARAIWARARNPKGTPALAFLSGRQAWPPCTWDGWPELPEPYRWVERERLIQAWPGVLKAGFPGTAAGALVVAYRPAGEAGAAVSGVSLDALDGEGRRTGEGGSWRKQRGTFACAVVTLPGAPEGGELAMVEGEADGLAVVVMATCGLCGFGDVGEVRVVGGTSGMVVEKAADPAGRPVLVVADGPGRDGKPSGGKAAVRLWTALQATGRPARFVLRDDGDVAYELAGVVMDRAIELCEGKGFQVAQTAAWRSILEGDCDGC